jgi:hypothetical protein
LPKILVTGSRYEAPAVADSKFREVAQDPENRCAGSHSFAQ